MYTSCNLAAASYTLLCWLAIALLQTAVMYILAHASRSFMTVANSTTVEGAEHMQAALDRRQGRPLITVCNHVASMDDPLVMSTILPPEVYSDASQLRCVIRQPLWTSCASLKLSAGRLPGIKLLFKIAHRAVPVVSV